MSRWHTWDAPAQYHGDPWSAPEYWVSVCYQCGHYVYWNEQYPSWCHLHYDGFTINHLGEPGAHSDYPACLLIEEEP